MMKLKMLMIVMFNYGDYEMGMIGIHMQTILLVPILKNNMLICQ